VSIFVLVASGSLARASSSLAQQHLLPEPASLAVMSIEISTGAPSSSLAVMRDSSDEQSRNLQTIVGNHNELRRAT